MKLKTILLTSSMALALSALILPAAHAANAQQNRMATCNADAKTKNLAGEERKQFMSSCLSNKPDTAAAPITQQEKMKTCNADAGKQALKGDARKQFMSNCLKAK